MIKIETTVQEAVKKINRFPKMLYMAANRTLSSAAVEIKQIMERPGLMPTYPIQWDTLKQKWFVIAKLRREKNLPYTRTNQHVNGFKMETLSNGYELSNIGNQAVFLWGAPSGIFESAVHVQPSGQSHIYEGRWPLIHKVIDAVLSRLPRELMDRIKTEVNE